MASEATTRTCNSCKYAALPGGSSPCSECVYDEHKPKWTPMVEFKVPTPAIEVTSEVILENKALTYDDGKAPLALLPWTLIDEMALVQGYGAAKYGDAHNYRKGMEVTRNLSCALRHIRKFLRGEDNDPESGKSHLAHAACRLGYVLENMADGVAIDDRYKRD